MGILSERTLTCPMCSKPFTTTHSTRVYCSNACRHEYYTTKLYVKRYPRISICDNCLEAFKQQDQHTRHCKDCIKVSCVQNTFDTPSSSDLRNKAALWSQEGELFEKPNRYYRGRYVYLWLDGSVPFYVGIGVDSRAWRIHYVGDRFNRRFASCESYRLKLGSKFSVYVVRDNLTNEGAMLLEESLRNCLSGIGFIMLNQVDGMKRQEIPPLELDAA